MFVLDIKNFTTDETDRLTGANVAEFCGNVIQYSNGINNESDNKVTFIDEKGKILLEIKEKSLFFAIFGTTDDSENDGVDENTKDESQSFWELDHNIVDSIEFENAAHKGTGIWDEAYEEDDDDEEEEEGEEEDEETHENTNY